jgi:hypothetical protein
MTENKIKMQILQGDPKLLSGFPFIDLGDPDNILESACSSPSFYSYIIVIH